MSAGGMGRGVPRPRIKVTGPLAPYAARWRGELAGRGYARGSATRQMRLMEQLSGYLEERDLGAVDLTQQVADGFLRARQVEGRAGPVSPKALAPLLGYLRGINVAPGLVVLGSGSPAEVLLEAYRTYLAVQRGLAPQSIRSYLGAARVFLAELAARDRSGAGWEDLSAGQVTAFVQRATAGHSVASAKIMVTALRSLLRFLHVEGIVPAPLAQVVPSVAGWKLSSLPRTLEPGQVAGLLASCDRVSR